MQDTWVRSLDQENPLEKEMATHSSIFAWEIPWTEEPGGLQSMGLQRVGHHGVTKQQQIVMKWLHFSPVISFVLISTLSDVDITFNIAPAFFAVISWYIFFSFIFFKPIFVFNLQCFLFIFGNQNIIGSCFCKNSMYRLQMGTCQERCQWLNNKGVCHLPLWRLGPMLL